ncbi:hypothetical protein TcWFU_006926 [Taenia crassiceps]|uniref:Uncharacterized protein n=1 Tax=Taenia crassiceps TaxID=6207 RepID=A0ABR4QH83_9CEST
MSSSKSSDGKNGSIDPDDEFVVPHMEIACTLNSTAYMRVLEEPFVYLHNWDSLNADVQKEVMEAFLEEARDVKEYLNSKDTTCVMPAESFKVGYRQGSCASASASTKCGHKRPHK